MFFYLQMVSYMRLGDNPLSSVPWVVLTQAPLETLSESNSKYDYTWRCLCLYLLKPLDFTSFCLSNTVPMVCFSNTHILTDHESSAFGFSGKFTLGCNFPLDPWWYQYLLRISSSSKCFSYILWVGPDFGLLPHIYNPSFLISKESCHFLDLFYQIWSQAFIF